VCDQQATQQLGNAFPETSRRSKVKKAEEGYRRTGDIRKLPKLPLYGRLQRHKKRYDSFSEEIKQNSRTCMEAINCIARMSCRMQFEIAKMFWLQQNRRLMETEINELQYGNMYLTGCGSYNGQLEEVFARNATGNAVNTEATARVPAARPASITSARCSGSSIASAPVQPTCICQSRERDTQFDDTCVASLSQNRDMYMSNNYREFTTPMSEYSSRNYCGPNGIPRVRMARTKMTACKDRDDRRRDDECRDDDRRSEERRGRDSAKPPPRRRRRGTPPPEKYICIFCQKENRQRINHKRHLVMQHACRMDGTPATAADIAQARAWSSKTPTDKGLYKSKEFVESTASEDDDDDETPESSSPARRKSPSPPRRKQTRRQRSVSPRRSTLSPPHASTSAPSTMVKVRKVRFDDKKGKPVSTSRPKVKSTETVTKATAPLETALATQHSRTAAASAQPEGRDKTAKRKEMPSIGEGKELIVSTPKLEGLVRVAKQAIESLKERKGAAEKSSEPPAKRPLLSEGLSTFAQKGKCAEPKLSTSAKVSEGTETSVAETESQKLAETPKTTKITESPSTAERLPVGEKKVMSQVEVDLAISTEASETETENYKDVTVATVHETYSDVEPSSPERVDVPEQPEPEVKMKPVMVPEILADFTESIVITDEDEPKLIVDMPTVSHGEDTQIVRARSPVSTTSTVIPADERESKFITSSAAVDVTARVPTKPAKVHTPPRRRIGKPETSMSEVSMGAEQRRVKSISSLHLANAAMNFNLTTIQIAEQIAIQYVMDNEQRIGVMREIQKLRLGAKTLALRIRSAFPLNVKNETDRSTFLDWLEGTTRLAASYESDDSPMEFVSTVKPPFRH